MSYKEWTAIIQLAGGVAVGLWLAQAILGGGPGDGTTASLAIAMLWAVGALIAFNVVGMVLVSVVLTVIRKKEFADEPADERDDMIDARSSRIGYAITSSLAALTLVPVAMGSDADLAITMLFIAPLAGGLAHATAQLAFYRLG